MGMVLWQPIPGINKNYLASEDGQIKRIAYYKDYPNGVKIFAKEKILKQWLRGEYLTIEIDSKSQSVHRLICAAFNDKLWGQDYVNHKNGDKLDNRKDNLEWCTKSENAKHMYATGLRKITRNEKHPSALYSDETINKVKDLLATRMKQRDIAKICGVSQSLVSCINRGLLRCCPT